MSALALLASYIPSFWYGTEIFVLCLTAILLTFLHDWLLCCYSNNHSISKWRSICSKKNQGDPAKVSFVNVPDTKEHEKSVNAPSTFMTCTYLRKSGGFLFP